MSFKKIDENLYNQNFRVLCEQQAKVAQLMACRLAVPKIQVQTPCAAN